MSRTMTFSNRTWAFGLLGAAGIAAVGFGATRADAQTITRFTSVLIANSVSSPVPVRDVTKTPTHFTTEVKLLNNNTWGQGLAGNVDANRTFVVTHVSARAVVPPNHPPLTVSLVSIGAASGGIAHELVGHREKGLDGHDVYVVSQPLSAYVESGASLYCGMQRTSSAGAVEIGSCVISGYYLD